MFTTDLLQPMLRRLAVAALVAVSAASMVTGAATAATKTPYDVNLVKNPGADTGPTGDGSTVVAIPSWTTTSTFTLVAYGTPGFPALIGTSMFSCGPGTASAKASQVITIKGRNAAIDAGSVQVAVFARLAATDADKATVVFAYRNAAGRVLRKDVVGPFTDTKLKFGGGGAGHPLPARTRSIKVTLRGERHTGAYCDAFFDDIEVKLSKS